jgi:hypothetical protein
VYSYISLERGLIVLVVLELRGRVRSRVVLANRVYYLVNIVLSVDLGLV